MARPLLPDGLWAEIAPLLPPEPAKPKGGRPRRSDRAALTGILFVLRSGTPWELLPREMGCGSGMTCWRRLRDWQKAGVWDRLQQTLLDRLGRQNGIDFSRASLDSASIAAKKGARRRARTRPTGASSARSVMSSPMRRASPSR
jgi:transposase